VTVILGPDGGPDSGHAAGSEAPAVARAAPLAGRGGTGKTRLAAEFAARLWAAGELDLLVWVDANSRDSILSGYAQALADIRLAAPVGRPEAAAARFLTWLAETGRRWLVVLDGLIDRTDAEGLWAQGPSGQSIVTTCLASLRPAPAPALALAPALAPAQAQAAAGPATDGAAPIPAVMSIGVPPFSPREALDFLSDRLNDDPYRSAGGLDLAMALQCMPAALELATTYLHDTGQDCRQYRLALERHRQAGTDDGDPLPASWMVAAERAMQFPPGDLAWPALRLAAVLSPAWIPGVLLTSRPACAYITGRRDITATDQAGVRAAFGNLQQVGLVSIDPADEARTVRIPATLQSSVRLVMEPAEIRRAVQAAADAMCATWPDGRASQAQLQQAFRYCATCLRRHDEQALWISGGHPLLLRIGSSLDAAGMTETALSYWRDLAERCAAYLGPRSPASLEVRERLAAAAMAAGRADEAAGLLERVAADMDETAGAASPQAISTRTSLVTALRTSGRLSDAILLGNQLASHSDRAVGSAHTLTTAVLWELARAYYDAEQFPLAIGTLERCAALRARANGLMHPETLAARHSLAAAYRRAGRGKDAIRLYQDVLGQLEAAGPAARADTVTAREDLAIACYHAGMTEEAVTTLQRALADWRRVPGADAASTLRARANLAAICCLSGRLKEAIRHYQSEAEDLERIHGKAHPDLFRARRNLAAAYHKARRLAEAVELGAATLADCEQNLGPGHRETLTLRANLAHAYHASGQLKRASAHFDRALRDCERARGTADQLTEAVRDLRVRYLAGRQGTAPIVSPPTDLSRGRCRVTAAA